MAAGLATLETYREEGLFQRAADLAPYWEDALHSLADCRHVVDIRNMGLIGAIELEPIAGAPTTCQSAGRLPSPPSERQMRVHE